SALQVRGLLRMSEHRIQSDVGEKNDGCSRKHPQGLTALGGSLTVNGDAEEADSRPAKGSNWLPVGRVNEEDADADDEQYRRDLDADHDGIEAGTFTDTFDQHDRDNGNDDDR